MIRAVSSRSWSSVPGSRQRGAAYVVGEVEVLVVDPDRVRETARHPAYALAVAGHERDPVVDVGEQRVVVEARRRPGRRSRAWRCAWASAASRRPAGRGRWRATARSCANPRPVSVHRASPVRGLQPHGILTEPVDAGRTPVPPDGGSDAPPRCSACSVAASPCCCAGHRVWRRRAGRLRRAGRRRVERRASPPTTSRAPTRHADAEAAGTDDRHHLRGRHGRPRGAKEQVKAGEPITLHIEADSAGELHVHSSPEQEIEYPAGTTEQDPHHRPARRRRGGGARPRTADRPARGALSCRLRSLPGAPARAGRGQGPADPARARHRRRHGRARRLLLRAGAGLAHAPLPGRRGRAARPRLARRGWSTTPGSSGRCGSSACCSSATCCGR